MEQQLLIQEFHRMVAKINATSFATEVGDFYQGESAVLACIAYMEQAGELPLPSAISARLHLARGTVTATLRSLERKHLVLRETMPDDRRHVRVVLTEAGHFQVEHKLAEVNQWCSRMIVSMGENDFTLLLAMLNKAIACMGL